MINKKFLRLVISALNVFCIVSCNVSSTPTLIKFKIHYDLEPLHHSELLECDQSFEHQNRSWQISQFQFFINNIQLKDINEKWHQANLLTSDKSSDQVALIGGACGQQQNWQIQVNSQLFKEQITGIQFTVGVPQQLNHQNPLTQLSPLNQPDMFWTWQLGHKFARIELTSNPHQWIFHLGSTGCSSPSPVRAPKLSCQNPNTVPIILDNFTTDHHVAINLKQLIQEIDLIEHSNCQSSLNTPACQLVLPRFGVNSNQHIFEVQQ